VISPRSSSTKVEEITALGKKIQEQLDASLKRLEDQRRAEEAEAEADPERAPTNEIDSDGSERSLGEISDSDPNMAQVDISDWIHSVDATTEQEEEATIESKVNAMQCDLRRLEEELLSPKGMPNPLPDESDSQLEDSRAELNVMDWLTDTEKDLPPRPFAGVPWYQLGGLAKSLQGGSGDPQTEHMLLNDLARVEEIKSRILEEAMLRVTQAAEGNQEAKRYEAWRREPKLSSQARLSEG